MARAPFQVLVLPYRRTAAQLEVAVFRRADYDVWQFVSGGGEGAETPDAAARREGQEEAGIDPARTYMRLDSTTSIPGSWFSAWATWGRDVLVIPEHAFAVDVADTDLVLCGEHRELAWLAHAEAMQRLRFDSNKNALWELHERLFPGPRVKRPAYR